MTKIKAVVLLSGGMDSATALWSVLRDPDVQVSSVVSCDYGQQGAHLELAAVSNLLSHIRYNLSLPATIGHTHITIPSLGSYSSLTSANTGRDDITDVHVNTTIPFTYVPARNLILLSLAAGIAFSDFANRIVGGWTEPDSAYPDCRPEFLDQAGVALNMSLGSDKPNVNSRGWVEIFAPVLGKTKREIVEWGSQLGVPWRFTRSCYKYTADPCMQCDSCIKRMTAFVEAGVRDPLIRDDSIWSGFIERTREAKEP